MCMVDGQDALANQAPIDRKIPAGVDRGHFALGLVGVYLAVSAVCWAAALPDYFSATDGFTATGARTGSLPFALTMAGISVALTVGAYLRTSRPDQLAKPTPGATAARP